MSVAEETPANVPEWKCFHCDFGTSNPKEAAAHFGDRDDAEEFKPLCKWWQRMDDGERAETLQDTIQQLNDERDALAAVEQRLREMEARNGVLEEALKQFFNERDTELDMMHCRFAYSTPENKAWHEGVQAVWGRLRVLTTHVKEFLAEAALTPDSTRKENVSR